MNKSQKNICVLVCLLILLILLCTFSHMGSIKVTKPMPADATDTQSIAAPIVQYPVDFVISKENETVSLSGNLDNQDHYDRLVAAYRSETLSHDVNVNSELADSEEVIRLTEALAEPFMSKYFNGSIRYQEGSVIVEGIVENRSDKNLIGSILANSRITSQDLTKVVEPIVPEPIVEIPKIPVIVEVNASDIPIPVEVNQTLPEVPEVNQTLPEVPEVPEVNVTLPIVPEVNLTLPEIPVVTEVESEEVKQIEAEIQKVIDFENINFQFDQADLTIKSLTTIQKIADILKANPNVKVEIGGHTDSTGDDNHNLKLSQKRVDQVKAELSKLGIEADRMTSIGYGETRPLVPNDSKENREKNRRVEFNIIGE